MAENRIHEILTEASTSDVPAADRMYARHVERLRGVAERDARGESPCQLAALLSNWAGVKEAIGSFDEAASLLREAAAILEASLGEDSGERWRETLAVAYLNLGTAYHKMRDEGSAVDAWMTCVRRCMEWDAVQEGPPLLEPLGRGSVALAYHEARSGNYKGALARLGGVETAVRKWGGDNTPGIEAVLASVADLRGQIDAHRQHDRKLSPRMEAAVLADKALALREKGQVAEALEHYRRALDLDPDDADIWVNYGAACDAAGDDGVARQAFDKAVCLAPDNATAWHNKGAILFQQGRYEEALPALEKAYALGHQASMNAVARCRGMLRRLAREKGR